MQRFLRWGLMPAIALAMLFISAAPRAEAGGGISITIGGYPSGGYGYGYRESYQGPYGASFRPGPHYYGVGWYTGPSPFGRGHGYGHGGYGGHSSHYHGHHHHDPHGW